MSLEAMKQALEALELSHPRFGIGTAIYARATASLRQAIAEAEKAEPVAWITGGGNGELWWHQSSKFDEEGNLIGENPDDIPLYTSPPQRQWVGLTDEERISIRERVQQYTPIDSVQYGFALQVATEQAIKEKNT